MFASELNGYNKNEVDKYIAKLKAEYEAVIMEEKLKVIESERKRLDAKKYSEEMESRQKNIISVLESYKKFQDEGNKNLEKLRSEQFKMVYQHILAFFDELKSKYPGIEHNDSYQQLLSDISKILNQDKKAQTVEQNHCDAVKESGKSVFFCYDFFKFIRISHSFGLLCVVLIYNV